MACKKAVIVSSAAPLKRLVNETDCGMVFRSGDVRDFTEKIIQLEDPSLRNKKGLNGFMAVKSKYNWENDSQVLRQAIRRMKPL
jgi:glycosyltransferase involved in cell wall biosynthesis